MTGRDGCEVPAEALATVRAMLGVLVASRGVAILTDRAMVRAILRESIAATSRRCEATGELSAMRVEALLALVRAVDLELGEGVAWDGRN